MPAAIVAIGLVYRIPFLGWLARVVVLSFGAGALLLTLWDRRPRRAMPHTPPPERVQASAPEPTPGFIPIPE